MGINFTGEYTSNTIEESIIFKADVDGKTVQCVVSAEALQDIEPLNAFSGCEIQFRAKKIEFQYLAEKKILEEMRGVLEILCHSANMFEKGMTHDTSFRF